MSDYQSTITYFPKSGKENTEKVLNLARLKAKELDISTAIIASTTGFTAKKAVDTLKDLNIIVVTHVAGYIKPDKQEFDPSIKKYVESHGARVLTAQHSFAGVNRAIRNTLGGYQVDEIIANVLRVFGQGLKVAFEISMMAADSGWVSCKEPLITIAGTHRGADFGVILIPANSYRLFDLKVIEIFCMPSLNHPSFNE